MTTISIAMQRPSRVGGRPSTGPRRGAMAATAPSPAQTRPATRVRTRLTRRGRVVLALLLIVPIAVGGAVLSTDAVAVAGGATSSSTHFREVTVRAGDSLWTIAERLDPRADPRAVVAAIVDLNGLSSGSVQPGQQLAIPPQYAGSAR